MAKYVALLRGINVGTAKQVPMAQLRSVLENVGARNVKTVLRSGNAVFEADAAPPAAAIEAELMRVTNVPASVLVLPAAQFADIADANPLGAVSSDGSKIFVTFLSEPVGDIRAPEASSIAPEQLRLGEHAVYQWFPEGSTQTKVPATFWKQFPGVITARNANTVEKLLKLLAD